eukprot:SAG11_NODE_9229_length_931_cov_0.868990_2_plen_27_part_01
MAYGKRYEIPGARIIVIPMVLVYRISV